ncbi:hypothetical protein [Rhodococcus sp. P1Y]|uniref:hypothetical protein n=1 Tax=Rhodococcus sp. P1Y TaxID=1302308 RepID=UPI000EB10895|nr:hypothetical protein [Rhodococcus sp. P1Y]AYJ52144.1 hypothetical protein D8W71_23220 [Rhodococcus sp. P1Y]
MMDPHRRSWHYVAAMFSYEFQDGGVDYDTIETVHRGEIGEWVDALTLSGLFERATVLDAEDTWRQQPRLLLDMLLLDADEMTRRRCLMAWSSLDRLAPIAQSG